MRFKWPCRLKTSFSDRDFLGILDILDIPRMVSPFSFLLSPFPHGSQLHLDSLFSYRLRHCCGEVGIYGRHRGVSCYHQFYV